MLFDHPDYDDHEQVTFVDDAETGLRAINAIHRGRGMTAGGGVRFRPYGSDTEALTDVLRLSKAMTYKMVLAGLPMGGAKSVIIGDPAQTKTPELLRAFGRFVASFDGRYTCVAGRASKSGSTAPPTALGVFHGIRATATAVFGSDDLIGRRVAVQGAGGVGTELTRLLTEAGAEVLISDVKAGAARATADQWGATMVDPAEILAADVDIVSPNAIGAVLDGESIPTIKAPAVCGAANNQLARPEHGDALAERNIVWAPDYVVSSGGAIAGTYDVGVISEAERDEKLAAIYHTTLAILIEARARGVSADVVANDMARWRLDDER
jgi:leucine dehydrogenase